MGTDNLIDLLKETVPLENYPLLAIFLYLLFIYHRLAKRVEDIQAKQNDFLESRLKMVDTTADIHHKTVQDQHTLNQEYLQRIAELQEAVGSKTFSDLQTFPVEIEPRPGDAQTINTKGDQDEDK